MTNKWVTFRERKPEEGGYLITASITKDGVSTETWKKWKKSNLTMTPKITHWWDGEPNFDLAIHNWWL